MPELKTTLPNPDAIIAKLRELQRLIRDAIVDSHRHSSVAERSAVKAVTSADTIYGIDALIEPIIEHFMDEWSRELPMVVIAEGIEPEAGRVFPAGARAEDCAVRIILDPIDGTRGIMYDKRPAWSLAGVAPNRGEATRLSDIEIAVMTELPTSKMGLADVLWATRGGGAHGVRESLASKASAPASERLLIQPSKADTIAHGFAMVSNFFPGTKVLASELLEHVVRELMGPADVGSASVFEDQYICTGGQFYELIVGHDRFNADLRPIFYAIQKQPMGLCCHPYDVCTMLIATEAGVLLTDGTGKPLDGPLDVTTGVTWAGFANATLKEKIEPIVLKFLEERRKINHEGTKARSGRQS